MDDHMIWADGPRQAARQGRPIVALESTIITHGMPAPENLSMLRRVEDTVRQTGAEPATIAVIDGRIHVGLSAALAEALAARADPMKLSRADLAFACASGGTGGTTVAATMMIAHAAGIAVFATGGIGGVHHGAETSFDISADLDELARTPVTVVCAGAKAILDLPKTLEALETRGVPVLAVGQDNLPAFWSRDSGLKAPLRLDTAEEIARFAGARQAVSAFGHGGVLVANPVPQDADIPTAEMSEHIDRARRDAHDAGIAGKDVTPWLLARLVELTDGRSLHTNIALVVANARLAGQIAVALEQREP